MVVQQSKLLERALERSRRVGDMLLQREEEELRKIEELAEELIARQYKAPARERPCKDQAAACLACYESHPEDPTLCYDAVEAYAACTRQATKAALRTEP